MADDPKKGWKRWAADHDALMREAYPHTRTADLARRMGRSRKSVLMRAKSLGLHKTQAFVEEHGGQFEAGQISHRAEPIGTERVNFWGVRQRKVCRPNGEHRGWVGVHVLEWERLHGQPVPPGHMVVFKDRDRTNFSPENLLLVSHAENMHRNSIHRYPAPLVQVMQLQGVLKKRIEERSRHEEQD